MKKVLIPLVALSLLSLSLKAANAAENAAPAAPNRAERLPVNALKDRYWARGDENELRVVQNRLYSKANKIEFGLSLGTSSSDPFLSTQQVGGSLGYFLTEYVGIELFGWAATASESDAGTSLRQQTRAQGTEVAPNTNKQKSFVGGQMRISPLYGKLSLVGKSIIYFDLFALAGAGMMKTENGSYIAPFVGLGQQVYLNRWLALRLDYRLMFYKERILSRSNTNFGAFVTERSNTTSAINVGVTFFWDLFG